MVFIFHLHAEKNKLTLLEREPVTSGSVNIYGVRFEFSAEWEGLDRTAVFEAAGVSREVLLGSSGACVIPWEVLAVPGVRLRAGVYGKRGGEIILPTVWANLGVILEGVPAGGGEGTLPPTPEIWEQELSRKVWAVARQTGPRRAAPHGFVVRCICHAPPARGVSQAAVGSGCHSSTAPPPPWRRLACAAGLPRKSVGGREQVSLSPALSSRPACHSRVKGSR